MARYYEARKKMPKHDGRAAKHESGRNTNAMWEVEPDPTTSGRMIETDPSKTSGCPTDVKVELYPKVGSFMPYGLSWGLEPMDRQMEADTSKGKQIVKPRKT